MPLDGLTFYHISNELNSILSGARVDKAQQPERDEIILSLRCAGENRMLLLSASAGCARAHLTNVKKANPLEPPNLCMLMRKHLIGGRITSVKQINCDRIIAIEIEHLDEMGDRTKKTIMCEFMGKYSNIMLLDAKGRIMEAARRVNDTMSGVREVLPGLMYELPPAHGKIPFTGCKPEELAGRLRGQSGRLDKLIQTNISGMSLPLSQEISFRVTGDAQFYADNPENYALQICEALTNLIENPAPRVLEEGKGELQCVEYTMCRGMNVTTYPTVSEAVDAFFLKRDLDERVSQKSASIHRVIKANIARLEKKLTLQEEAYTSGARAEEYRIKGEMLAASPYLVKKGMKSVELPNFYDPDCKPITVELDEKLNAAANSQRYFKLYKKAQVARKLAAEQLAAGREELEYLEGQLDNLTRCDDENTLAELKEELIRLGYIKDTVSRRDKKALPPSKPYEFTAPDGTLILAGHNNLQNDGLTFAALPTETWLHTKDIPGSHVIIKSEHPSDETIVYAARIAAKLSKAGGSSHVPVDYVLRRYVKKPAGAKPGKVIFTHNRTLYVDPLE